LNLKSHYLFYHKSSDINIKAKYNLTHIESVPINSQLLKSSLRLTDFQ